MAKRRTNVRRNAGQTAIARVRKTGEQIVGRIQHDARSLLARGRSELTKDVRGFQRTVRQLETRVVKQLHAATERQVRSLSARVGRLEKRLASLERRASG